MCCEGVVTKCGALYVHIVALRGEKVSFINVKKLGGTGNEGCEEICEG